MYGYFEDAASIDYSLTQKYPFYSFINSSWQNTFPMVAHWHYYVEILYATEGRGRVIINGYTYDFRKGDILFAFPKDVHALNTVAKQPFEYLVIKLDPDMLFDATNDAFMFKHFSQLLFPVPPEYKLIRQQQGFDPETLKRVHDLFMNRPYSFDWKIKAILFDFFQWYSVWLNDKGYKINGDANNEDISSITPAFAYIHENFHKPLTAADVAEHCHLSYSYFSRQFKKVTGISFTQYLNFTRITEAEKLLLMHKNNVTDIGFKVGFSDTSYFIRQFKALKKITPKKFLQLVKEDF